MTEVSERGESSLPIENETLVTDLLEWVSSRPRTYAETMDAWRTSCLRLTIWEDAIDLGFVVRDYRKGSAPAVRITSGGRKFLEARRASIS